MPATWSTLPAAKPRAMDDPIVHLLGVLADLKNLLHCAPTMHAIIWSHCQLYRPLNCAARNFYGHFAYISSWISCCFPFAVQCLILVNWLAALECMLRLSIGIYCAFNLGNDLDSEMLKTCCMSPFPPTAAAIDSTHGLDIWFVPWSCLYLLDIAAVFSISSLNFVLGYINLWLHINLKHIAALLHK